MRLTEKDIGKKFTGSHLHGSDWAKLIYVTTKGELLMEEEDGSGVVWNGDLDIWKPYEHDERGWGGVFKSEDILKSKEPARPWLKCPDCNGLFGVNAGFHPCIGGKIGVCKLEDHNLKSKPFAPEYKPKKIYAPALYLGVKNFSEKSGIISGALYSSKKDAEEASGLTSQEVVWPAIPNKDGFYEVEE